MEKSCQISMKSRFYEKRMLNNCDSNHANCK